MRDAHALRLAGRALVQKSQAGSSRRARRRVWRRSGQRQALVTRRAQRGRRARPAKLAAGAGERVPVRVREYPPRAAVIDARTRAPARGASALTQNGDESRPPAGEIAFRCTRRRCARDERDAIAACETAAAVRAAASCAARAASASVIAERRRPARAPAAPADARASRQQRRDVWRGDGDGSAFVPFARGAAGDLSLAARVAVPGRTAQPPSQASRMRLESSASHRTSARPPCRSIVRFPPACVTSPRASPARPTCSRSPEGPLPQPQRRRSADRSEPRRRQPAGLRAARGNVSAAAGCVADHRSRSRRAPSSPAARTSRRGESGDDVCALTPGGGYAEYCTTPAGLLPADSARDCRSLEAASLPENYFTVWNNLHRSRPSRARREGARSTAARAASASPRSSSRRQFGATVFTTAGSDDKTAFCRDARRRSRDQLPDAGLRRRGRADHRQDRRRRHPRHGRRRLHREEPEVPRARGPARR